MKNEISVFLTCLPRSALFFSLDVTVSVSAFVSLR